MTKYERLSGVLDRQQKYGVRDTVVAVVLVLGLALAAIAVVWQLTTVVPSDTATTDTPVHVDSTSYTAQLLADSPDLQ